MECRALGSAASGFVCRLSEVEKQLRFAFREDAIQEVKRLAETCGFEMVIRTSKQNVAYVSCRLCHSKLNPCPFKLKLVNAAAKAGRETPNEMWRIVDVDDTHNHAPMKTNAKPAQQQDRQQQQQQQEAATSRPPEWYQPRKTPNEQQGEEISALSDARVINAAVVDQDDDDDDDSEDDGDEKDEETSASTSNNHSLQRHDDDDDHHHHHHQLHHTGVAATSSNRVIFALDRLSTVHQSLDSTWTGHPSTTLCSPYLSAAAPKALEGGGDLEINLLTELMMLPLDQTLQSLEGVALQNSTEGELIQHRIHELLVELYRFRRSL